eukprot:SAG31_NODE_29221_length_399_cov_0.516667_1_plen_44_part_10
MVSGNSAMAAPSAEPRNAGDRGFLGQKFSEPVWRSSKPRTDRYQ